MGGETPPVAVPEKIIGLTLILDFFDRCHSLGSFHLPQAALPSFPSRHASPEKGKMFRLARGVFMDGSQDKRIAPLEGSWQPERAD